MFCGYIQIEEFAIAFYFIWDIVPFFSKSEMPCWFKWTILKVNLVKVSFTYSQNSPLLDVCSGYVVRSVCIWVIDTTIGIRALLPPKVPKSSSVVSSLSQHLTLATLISMEISILLHEIIIMVNLLRDFPIASTLVFLG